MISSVSSAISAYTSSQTEQNQKTHRQPPPPPEEDTFELADTNEDGVVSYDELAVAIGAVEEVAGTSISEDEALSNYDLNGDDALSGEEFLEMLSGYGVAAPNGGPSSDSGGTLQPQQESMARALDVYAQNNGSAPVDSLIEMLNNNSDETGTFSSIDVDV